MKRKWFRYWKQTVLVTFVILAGLLYCSMAWRGVPPDVPSLEYAGETAAAESVPEETMPQESEPPACYVYVCGEVTNPGVYILAEGQRLYEAVEMAGGFTENAAPDALNLVLLVSDGMKIDVPDKERAAAMPSGDYVSGTGIAGSVKVNINTATREQLMTLNGIGAARADAIIAYRQEHGPFSAIEDIMQVSGIKDAAFSKIKNDIVVR